MAKRRTSSIVPTGALLTLLLGAVIVPALLSLSVGIVALALWRAAFDIVFGVLILSFAAMSVSGGVAAIAFVRRSARVAEMQTDFVANVSHELRTPLAGIRLLVETLAQGRASKAQERAEVMERLTAEVRRLEEQVTRILKWRRLESGVLALRRMPVPVAPLVEEAIRSLEGSVDIDSVQVYLDPELPPVRGDHETLLDAMRNLIHNAIKFGGDRGPIAINGRQNGNQVIIEVQDQGPGIPASDRKQIFERFYRVPVHPRARQGTGLGLAIVRRVVEWHRGRLSVESEPGIGSTFILQLPAVQEDPNEMRALSAQPLPADSKEPTAGGPPGG